MAMVARAGLLPALRRGRRPRVTTVRPSRGNCSTKRCPKVHPPHGGGLSLFPQALEKGQERVYVQGR